MLAPAKPRSVRWQKRSVSVRRWCGGLLLDAEYQRLAWFKSWHVGCIVMIRSLDLFIIQEN